MSAAAKRVATTHPFIILAAIMGGFLVSALVQSASLPPILRGILFASPFIAICGWLWAVFHISNGVLPDSKSSHWGWACAVPPVVTFMAGAAGWSTTNSPPAFAFFISFFVSIWLAARALEKANDPDLSPSVGRVMGTAVLMYFTPVGVWVLRNKVSRVAERFQ